MVELHKNNRFSNKTTIGRVKRPQNNYEFATGFPEALGKNNSKAKTDQGTFELDQNLNYLQTPKVDSD